MAFVPSSSSSSAAVNLRLKLMNWFSMYSGLFRRSRDQEHESLASLLREIKEGHHGLKDGSPPSKDKDSSSSPEYLNYGEEDQMEIEGYKRCSGRTIITWIFIILTLGLLRLIFHWWPRLLLYATHKKCPIRIADKILAMEHYQEKYKRYYVKPIRVISADLFKRSKTPLLPDQINESTMANTWDRRLEEELRNIDSPKLAIPKSNGTMQEADQVRVFSCKKLRYVWDEQYETFSKLQGLDGASSHFLHQNVGLSVFEQCQRRLIYGNNEIKVEVQGIMKLLFLEVLNPFYVFQIFSVALWMSDNYIYFATAVIIMSVLGIVSTIVQTRQNQKKLKTTVQSSDIVTVCRGGGVFEAIPTEHLVPGDLIVIPSHGCTMQCDAALLSGNCIVNESMLTGESVPVTKIPLPNRLDIFYNSKDHARHTLFSGTHVMQTRYYGNERVLAVILRTGFLTSKGNLVRSILYPPPVDYKFERDSYKFIAVLACIAGVGFINSIFIKLSHGDSIRDIIVDSLDLITIVVPPALPAAMTVGRLHAQRRLQKKGIYCISPRAINVSGSIDCVCFDKTGTLTEEGLDLWGAVPMGDSSSSSQETGEDEESWKKEKRQLNQASSPLSPGSNSTTTMTMTRTTTTTTIGTPTREFQAPVRQVDHLSGHETFLVGMAACHSLTKIDGNLIGDPLDLKMFEWTGWILEEPSVADNEKFDMIAPTIVRPKLLEVNDNVPFPKERPINAEDNHNHHHQHGSLLTNNNGSLTNPNTMTPTADSLNSSPTNMGSSGSGLEVGIVRQFPFSSSLQRMSVITRTLGAADFELFLKGSPEMISSLALPHTIPDNFATTLERYTKQGYRVIALGHRILPKMNYAKVQRIVREEVEKELHFLGLIIMENRLKAETAGVMRVLKNAAIRTIMVTGDNILTALSVARECGMLEATDKVIVLNTDVDNNSTTKLPRLQYTLANKVNPMEVESVTAAGSPVMSIGNGSGSNLEKNLLSTSSSSGATSIETPVNRYHFAISGNAFSVVKTHYPELLPRLLVRGTVFARMSPDQKQQLVELLQALGYFVGMCGDGANDCGALKAAHAGISLSEAESSVASPFTSKDQNITCVPDLIREGRGALVTSFGIFKYMAVYSLTQFISVIILYTIAANLSDLQFLYIDLFLISVFALFFGHTEPYPGPLEKRPPSASLVSLAPIVSIICHIVTVLGLQILAFVYVQQQNWFVPYKANPDPDFVDDFRCFENYSLFAMSSFQYIIMAIVFSRGKPYRKSLITNSGLLVALILMTGVTIYLILWPPWWAQHYNGMQIKPPPDFSFRLILIGFGVCNLVIALLIEHGIVNFILGKKMEYFRFSKNGPKSEKEYDKIEYDLGQRTEWPPVASTTGPQWYNYGQTPPAHFPTTAPMVHNNGQQQQQQQVLNENHLNSQNMQQQQQQLPLGNSSMIIETEAAAKGRSISPVQHVNMTISRGLSVEDNEDVAKTVHIPNNNNQFSPPSSHPATAAAGDSRSCSLGKNDNEFLSNTTNTVPVNPQCSIPSNGSVSGSHS